MNDMYEMSITTHYYSVIGILIVILLNFWMLVRAENRVDYQRQMSLFTPIGSIAIGGVIFTGIIMMAAKHLEFSIENIIMIIFSIAIIILEVKRVKTLKYLREDLASYKSYAKVLLGIEVFLTMSISAWMLI